MEDILITSNLNIKPSIHKHLIHFRHNKELPPMATLKTTQTTNHINNLLIRFSLFQDPIMVRNLEVLFFRGRSAFYEGCSNFLHS